MAQISWRAPDELVARVRQVARDEGRSMNDYITQVMDAATNPDLAGSERDRIRERLARAGLLVPPGPARSRPAPASVAQARRAAGAAGPPASDVVSEGRG